MNERGRHCLREAPVKAPNANAHAERWVRTVREECLDWLLIVGRRHIWLMTSHRLALSALDRAHQALNHAASELTIAMLASPSTRLPADACVLAEAVEREAAAVEATLARESATDDCPH